MTKKQLWSTGSKLNSLVEAYTVWEDYILDMELLPYDIQASLAHAKMLKKIWTLSEDELKLLEKWLSEILELWKKWEFIIEKSQEDCHTAIEQYLTQNYWEVGKKIHTWRSRNDQVLVMTRLFEKESISEIKILLQDLEKSWKEKLENIWEIPMPGFTHMQKAMPTTVWTWLGSYINWFSDLAPLLEATQKLVDQNPLGSASGYWIRNFAIDKEFTTLEMWFNKTQENPMYAGYSRGYFEKIVLENLWNYMLLFWKFSSDLMLFTMSEFKYFSLPMEFTTGSSIMPQKRNYDLFEIMRWNIKKYFSCPDKIRNIISTIWSGYHRDLQLTKKPFIEWIHLFKDTVILLTEIIKHLEINKENLEKAMTPDLYVTEKVYDKVNAWESFRDAYLQVKEEWFKKS